MSATAKVKEKGHKLRQYIRLRRLFAKKCEFGIIHPELMSLWEKKFRQMIRYSSDRTFPIAEEFVSVKFEKCTNRDACQNNSNIPTLICAVKNDVDKMRYLMEHYRNLGIVEFVFLDNMSTDGTFEFLMRQPDTIVYRCAHPFTADRKIAWMNRLIAEVGINKWYLMVDSDELVTYVGASKYDFADVVCKCKEKGYKRLGSVMLDMYPKGSLFDASSKDNLITSYCYLDKDTYTRIKASNGIKIVGGPRTRVFGTRMKLSKYCLFYFEEDDVIPSAHFLIPFEKSFDVPVALVMLHYKFVNESDYNKVIEAVETGMHSQDSAEYKTYFNGITQNQEVSFYSEEHSVLFTEENLERIEIIDNIFED